MIDFNDAENALEFLKSTDKEAARLKARYNALDDFKKPALALIYNGIEKGSAADKTKQSEGHQEYLSHLENIRVANEEWLCMYNQRKSAELQIEMWRSVNSNQRKGNV